MHGAPSRRVLSVADFPRFFERLAAPYRGPVLGPSMQADWANGLSDVVGATSIEVAYEEGLAPPGVSHSPNHQDGVESTHVTPQSVDVIATYVTWHLSRDHWGICFHERSFWDCVRDLAPLSRSASRRRGQRVDTVSGTAYLCVREHEYLHFAGEVLATQLEALTGQSLFVEYLTNNYRAGNASASSLEEALATASEIQLAIARRTGKSGNGFDAIGISVFDLPNNGSPVTLVSCPPAPSSGSNFHYAGMIVRMANEYDATFAHI